MPLTTTQPASAPPDQPDVAALVRSTLQSYAPAPAMLIEIEVRGDLNGTYRRFADGLGHLREEWFHGGPDEPTVSLWNDAGSFESWPTEEEPNRWVKHGVPRPFAVSYLTLGLPEACAEQWRYLGLEVLLGVEAWHIGCGSTEFWIDRQRLLVVRRLDRPDPLHTTVDVRTVTNLEIGPQPPELFELPPDAVVSE